MRTIAVLLFFVLTPFSAAAQEAKTFRSELALATKAAEGNDSAGYLRHMQEAMHLEHDRIGRPFYQYHLARAQAMAGRIDDALATLEAAWNERVEGPMIVFADTDPAFARVRESPGYARIRALFDALRIDVTPAGGSVHEIAGAGCNLAASVGSDGILLVDSGYPRTSASLRGALKNLAGAEPVVRFVVNTHGHYDHAAANHDAAPAAVVIAHPAAMQEMQNGSDFVPGFRIPPVDPAALPRVLTDGKLTLRFNGEAVHVVALPAHTAGDVVVWFEGSRVLHMGDNYFGTTTTRTYPGENPAAYFATLGPLLESVPDDAIVLSGHAGRVPAAKLKEAFGASRRLFVLVRDALAAGKKDEVIVAEAEAGGHPRPWIDFYLKTLRK